MNNPTTLEDYYRYWDEFYVAWCHNDMNAIQRLGWTSVNIKSVTTQYLPEPWWGNRGGTDQPLESVVVNFNPGPGGEKQLRKNFSCSCRYSRYVTTQVNNYVNGGNVKSICATSNWHYGNRASKIYETLKCHKYNHYDLRNHLSVELVPWHSVSSNDIIRYCSKNRYAIFDYCIKFAAEASKYIKNPQLHNIVILRMSSSFFKQVMGGIGGLNYLKEEHVIHNISAIPSKRELIVTSIKEYNESDASLGCIEAYYCIFEFLSIPGVKFACIWGPKTRNNFPNQDCMKEIIKQITIFKLTNL